MENVKKIQTSFTLNDNGDILIRIKPLEVGKVNDNGLTEFTENEEKDAISNCSFFFYVPNPKSQNQEFIYFDS